MNVSPIIWCIVAATSVLLGIAPPTRGKPEPKGYPPLVIAPVVPPRKINDRGLPPISVDDPFNEEDASRTSANMLTPERIRAMLDNEESLFWQAARREVWGEYGGMRNTVKAQRIARQRGMGEIVVGRASNGYRSGKKLVALTFDDGPHTATTLPILAILKQHRVPATFFFVGTMAERHPDLVRSAMADGHSVGNHTFHHVAMAELSKADAMTEIKACGNVLRASSGVMPHLFRPPGGRYNARIAEDAAALGYRTILWTCDPGDYLRLPPATITDRTVKTITPGGIVLLHSGVPETILALPEIIKSLRKAGYESVTVETLLNNKKLMPSRNAVSKYLGQAGRH